MAEKTAKILVVEDERAIREMLVLFLKQQQFDVIEAPDYPTAVKKMAEKPQLILVDWMLPGRSGIQFIQYLKKHPDMQSIPVIMLTARSGEQDCVLGLSEGADDYITKPFSPKVLLARIEALLRRIYQKNHRIIDIDGLRLDQDAKRVTYQQQEITLSHTEFKLLDFFMHNKEKVYSREQLLDFIWGNNIYLEERSVDVYIKRLRHCLAPYQLDKYIQTVRGMGYRFSSQIND